MMEAARTSETVVNFCQTTRRYNSKDSPLRTSNRTQLISNLLAKQMRIPYQRSMLQSIVHRLLYLSNKYWTSSIVYEQKFCYCGLQGKNLIKIHKTGIPLYITDYNVEFTVESTMWSRVDVSNSFYVTGIRKEVFIICCFPNLQIRFPTVWHIFF